MADLHPILKTPRASGFLNTSIDSINYNYKPPLLSGWLKKQGESLPKSWKKRFFKQDSNSLLLYYYNSNGDVSSSLGSIDLKRSVRIEDHSELSFHLITEKRVFKLQASKLEEKLEWMEGIRRWIDYYDLIHSKMRGNNVTARGSCDTDETLLSYTSIVESESEDSVKEASDSSKKKEKEEEKLKKENEDESRGTRSLNGSFKQREEKKEPSPMMDIFKLNSSINMFSAAAISNLPKKKKKEKEGMEVKLLEDSPNKSEIQVDFNANKELRRSNSKRSIVSPTARSIEREERINLKELLKNFEDEFEKSDINKKLKRNRKNSGSMAKFRNITFQWRVNKFLLFWFGLSLIVLASLTLPLGFFLGAILGFFSFALMLIFFVTLWIGKGSLTGDNLPHLFPEIIDFKDDDNYNLYKAKYSALRHILETQTSFENDLRDHDWFNSLFDRIFQEHTHNKAFMDRYIEKINARLQLTKRPGYVGKITVDSVEWGDNSIRIVDRIQSVPAKREGEKRTEFHIEYSGNSPPKITMSVEIFINWPTERFATVVVSVRVAINFLSGKVCFVMPPKEDSLCTLAFKEDPVSSFTAESLIGNKTKLQNIPKISSFLIKKIQTFLRKELMEPNGITFHIPLKGQRKLKPLLLTAWRKKYGGEDLNASSNSRDLSNSNSS